MPDASYSEIQVAYQSISQKLQSEKNVSNRDEIDYKQKILDVAFHALAYDAKVIKQNAPANIATPRTALTQPLNSLR